MANSPFTEGQRQKSVIQCKAKVILTVCDVLHEKEV